MGRVSANLKIGWLEARCFFSRLRPDDSRAILATAVISGFNARQSGIDVADSILLPFVEHFCDARGNFGLGLFLALRLNIAGELCRSLLPFRSFRDQSPAFMLQPIFHSIHECLIHAASKVTALCLM
jgi:hypothetical protein